MIIISLFSSLFILTFSTSVLSKESVKIPDENLDLKQLLPPQDKKYKGKKTLVIDLDETLVHSKFTETVEQKPDHSFKIYLNNEKFISSSNTDEINVRYLNFFYCHKKHNIKE